MYISRDIKIYKKIKIIIYLNKLSIVYLDHDVSYITYIYYKRLYTCSVYLVLFAGDCDIIIYNSG